MGEFLKETGAYHGVKEALADAVDAADYEAIAADLFEKSRKEGHRLVELKRRRSSVVLSGGESFSEHAIELMLCEERLECLVAAYSSVAGMAERAEVAESQALAHEFAVNG